MDPTEILGASDEDFLNAAPPPADAAPVVEQEAAAGAATPTTEEVTQPTAEELAEQQRQVDETTAQENQPTQKELDAQAAIEKTPEELEAERLAAEAEPDYKALYEGLIKPLKANGKEIELRSHDELIQLAQQGANYTRKMQQLAPHRKTLMMLENNDLLDPEKLGFLIDLNRKDPAAVQKYLKEAQLNPLDIDVDADPTYRGGAHVVTDAQANFQEALDDARSSEAGMNVLRAIDSTWDQASKELVYNQPAIIATMVQQQESGVYERIATEMDRQRILGRLPAGATWLENYKTVGDMMVANGSFNDLVAQQPQQRQTAQPVAAAPVATRVIAPKPQVTASDKAAAAAPSRTAAAPAKSAKNPLSVSDEEFMKQFENRL